jgi:hypothetical protein
MLESDDQIGDEVLFQNELGMKMFGLEFENNTPNSLKNQALIAKKIFKPTEHLAADSIAPMKPELTRSTEMDCLSLQNIFSNYD